MLVINALRTALWVWSRSCYRSTKRWVFSAILQKYLAGMYTLYKSNDYWQQWSRVGTASRSPCSEQLCGTTEKEEHRVRRMSLAHRCAYAPEIRSALGITAMSDSEMRRRVYQRQSLHPKIIFREGVLSPPQWVPAEPVNLSALHPTHSWPRVVLCTSI